MPVPEVYPSQRRLSTMQAAALVALVAGLRFWTADYSASPLPYFDQWLAEFNNLFLFGTLDHSPFAIWFAPHNEHYPVTMKLVSMLGVLLNDYWDVKFLLLASGLVRALCAGLAWLLLTERAATRQRIVLWLFCAAAFGLPWSAFNALNGMQISFYFADLAMLLSLLVMQRWQDWRSGCALVALMLIGLASMGSALAIPLATGGLHFSQRRRRPGFLAFWLLSLGLAVAYVLIRVGTDAASLQSLAATLQFLGILFAWPLPSAWWGAVVLTGGALFLWRNRKSSLGAGAEIAFALGVFAVGNVVMLAMQRSPEEFHPRHWDTIGWLPFGLLALLLMLALSPRMHRLARGASVIVVAGVSLALAGVFFQTTWPDLQASHRHRDAIVGHYRHAFLSGEFRAESDRVNEQLAALDYSFFDDPVGRFAVHPLVAINIAAAPLPSLALLSPEILPTREPSLTSRLVAGLLQAGLAIATLALLAFIGLCLNERKRHTVES